MSIVLHHGDALDILRTLPDASIDAVVTDPPYGLAKHKPATIAAAMTAWCSGDRDHVPDQRGFMGRAWDGFVPPPAVWDECLRVLKPGGHLLAFAGSRTADLMGLSIRLAGFEMRDSIGSASALIAWSYGSGFPKSLNVSRDKRFCQCLPGVRDAATDTAAESAAQVLLAEVHGGRPDDAADLSDLHGMPVALHSDYALPGSAEQDVFGEVRGEVAIGGEGRAAVEQERPNHAAVCPMRSPRNPVAEQGEAAAGDVLLAELPCKGERGDTGGQPARPDGHQEAAPLRSGQPGVEGRGDVQALEGELHRPALRPLPGGPDGNGAVGRLRDGAPARDGAVGRSPADADGVREPRGPQPAEQRPVEPGSLADERGPQAGRGWPLCPGCGKPRVAPGLGTALKPAWEPIIVARKPLAGTVAANVLAHGTGAINIDGCRVRTDWSTDPNRRGWQGGNSQSVGVTGNFGNTGDRVAEPHTSGRWPSNAVFTHAPCCGPDEAPGECAPGCPVAELDAQSEGTRAAKPSGTGSRSHAGEGWGMGAMAAPQKFMDSGGASRFFPTFRYQAKAPSRERPKVDGVAHPTVKPLALCKWLVRLVTPPGGLVLDPFAGSGTTLQAARDEGFTAIGIEREASYLPLIRLRLGEGVEVVTHDEPEPVDPVLAAIHEAELTPGAFNALHREHRLVWTDAHTAAARARLDSAGVSHR